MSEVTRHRPWGDSVPTEFVLASDYDQLKAENDRLNEEVRSWVIRIQQRGLEMDELSNERDTVRNQLDEARELLSDSRNKVNYMLQHGEWYQPQLLLERIDAWMEANKV